MNFILKIVEALIMFIYYPSQISVWLDDIYRPANSVLSVRRLRVGQSTGSSRVGVIPLYLKTKEDCSKHGVFLK
jgi:hypothetical protein